MSAIYKAYDFAMNNILKLKNILNVLDQSGYLLIIILVICGVLIHFLLYHFIRLGLTFQEEESDEEKKNND